MRSDLEVQRACELWQLGLPHRPTAGRAGELLGRGTGSSQEFQEFRQYLPGDDIRHIDWTAYARSDSLMLRQYREELSPRTEILLDASRSMRFGSPLAHRSAGKQKAASQLATLFALLAARLGGRPLVRLLDDNRPLRALNVEDLEQLSTLQFDAAGSPQSALADHAIPPAQRSVRIFLSDFLFEHDPDRLLKQLALGASTLWVIQLLTAWEADPQPLGGRRLVDAETGSEQNLVIDAATIKQYQQRLKRLQDGLASACQRVHGHFVTAVTDVGLQGICRDVLAPRELLRPA